MAQLIKWWKSKFFLTILGLLILNMVAVFLLLYFVASPWWWIGLTVITISIGAYIRHLVSKKIEEITKNKMK